jgi:hypothetical protein
MANSSQKKAQELCGEHYTMIPVLGQDGCLLCYAAQLNDVNVEIFSCGADAGFECVC